MASVCYRMGASAYKRGIKAAAQDKAMMDYIKKHSTGVGSSIPSLRQWNKGWADAHAKASDKALIKSGLFTRKDLTKMRYARKRR